MEDLLTSLANATDDELLTSISESSFGNESHLSIDNEKSETNENNTNDQMSKSLNQKTSKKSQLIKNYKKWRFFLLTWKRLELLKLDWARRKLGIENINDSETYLKFWYF